MAEAINDYTGDEGRANNGDRFIASQQESFLPRNASFASASMDVAGTNRAFGDRSANSGPTLPDLTITHPVPVFPRTNEAANFLSPAYKAPSLQELTNRRQMSGDVSLNTVARSNLGAGTGDSLDRLSRSALNYVSTNADQLRQSVARGPFEASRSSAQRFLPGMTISGPAASSYNFETPGNSWQQFNGGFQGCPCPNCASGAYRPDAGPRPYQQQPWATQQQWAPQQQQSMYSFQGYDPGGRFDYNAGRFPQQNPQRYDSMLPPPGEYRMRNSNRVTPDLLPPGWFEEIYGSPNDPAPRPSPQDRPRPGPGYRPDSPDRPRPPGPGNYDLNNLPPPRPELVRPGESDIRMLSEPSISPEKIDEILRQYRSPAAGVGRELYALGLKYGIDPAIALGFFIVESTAGRHGRASRNMSWGNIKGRGPAGSDGSFRRYNTWAEGAEDWFRLIRYQYVATEPNEHNRRPFGAETLRAVIRRYAPGSDGNNEGGYVRNVINMRQRWAREMMAQQPPQQRTAETER